MGMGRPIGSKDKVKRKVRSVWTAFEEEFLRTHYSEKSNVELAKLLNKSKDNIKMRARKLGLTKHIEIKLDKLEKVRGKSGVCGLYCGETDTYLLVASRNMEEAIKAELFMLERELHPILGLKTDWEKFGESFSIRIFCYIGEKYLRENEEKFRGILQEKLYS